MKISLNGEWRFRQLDSDNWLDAKVPGCNFLDLMDNKIIPDPFYGDNEKQVQWVNEKDWEYSKSFELTEEMLSADSLMLHFDMLDTICDVFVNSKKVVSAINCHISYDLSIREYAVSGENNLRIVFYSPAQYVKKARRKVHAPINFNGMNGIVHIRKPQCHFGWDWGPVLPLCGITGDVWLEIISKAKSKDLKISQKHLEGKVLLRAGAEISNFTGEDISCEITLCHPDGKQVTSAGSTAEFLIENPELWWTYELSGKEKQPLYTVTATLKSGDSEIYSYRKKTGLRTLVLDTSADKYGSNFRFILNGVPLFIKGANYIPPDSFITRFTEKRLDDLLDCVRFSNLNMIRIWGGGYYGTDRLYDECDDRGILIWQDFCFACQAYPFFIDSFLGNVMNEVEFNVKRLSSHPSLALWNGNNEIEEMSLAWFWMKKYVRWTEKFFYHILPDEIRKYDTDTPYSPGSPSGSGFGKNIESDNSGDTHIWGVWHGLKPMTYYRSRATRFCSEFGFECLPEIKTISRFADKNEYNLKSDTMISHQKCKSGNDKILYYLVSRFHLPIEFEHLIYLSQLAQQECIRDATEFWRRSKGRCNGSMYWQLNDCWPCVSWSGYDYYGGYKSLQYASRQFSAPLALSFDDSGETIRLFVLNDLNKALDFEVRHEIFDFYSGKIESGSEKLTTKPLENQEVLSFTVKELSEKCDLKRTGIYAELICNNEVVNRKTLLFDAERNLNLPKAQIKLVTEQTENSLAIHLESDTFARAVNLESSVSYVPFSDNYFDLRPKEKRIIIIKKDPCFTLDELAESISVKSLSDITAGYTDSEEKIIKNKVFLSLWNIANCITHGQKGDS